MRSVILVKSPIGRQQASLLILDALTGEIPNRGASE